LLGAVDVGSDAFENTKLTDAEKAAIRDVMDNYDVYVGGGKVIDVLFMTYVDTPFIDGKPDYTTCQPQIVPIFGTFYVENEPVDGEFNSSVSFQKVKYDGIFPVAPDEFSFDLFEIIGDDQEKYIGTFYTDTEGKVAAPNLSPGEYVFKENWAFYQTPGGAISWKFVWEPQYPNGKDGLYFKIQDGKVIWEDYGEDPVLNNELLCKHELIWVNELNGTEAAAGAIVAEVDGGWITLGSGKCGGHCVADYRPATCTTNEIIWFSCDKAGNGICDAMVFNVIISGPLGHLEDVFELGANPGLVWVRCSRCGQLVYPTTQYMPEKWCELKGIEYDPAEW
jgi:hypothetical protein